MPANDANIYFADVAHRRSVRPVHQLRYRLAYIRVNLGEVEKLFGRLSPFGLALKDYGPDGCQDLEGFLRNTARSVADDVSGDICLITLPKVFGFGFNPISFFILHDKAGTARAIVYEVRNTFGERHHYCASLEGPTHQCAKAFHVSPFLDDEGYYRFTFREQHGLKATITKVGVDGPELFARLEAKAEPLTAGAMAKALLTVPVQGAGILLSIYYEALKMLIKRAPIFPYQHRKAHALQLTEAHHDH